MNTVRKTLDIVKLAMQLKNEQSEIDKQGDPTMYHYTHGQIQVLEFVINGKLLPEEMEQELNKMYNNSIYQYQNWGQHQVNDQNVYSELCGAADILAWILDISEEAHKENIGLE